MNQEYKREKLTQHLNYNLFILMNMLFMTLAGIVGVFNYVKHGEILSVAIAGVITLVCIMLMINNKIKTKMIYKIGGD